MGLFICQICGLDWFGENSCTCSEHVKNCVEDLQSKIYALESKIGQYKNPVRHIIENYIDQIQNDSDTITIKKDAIKALYDATECTWWGETYQKFCETMGHYLSIIIWSNHLFSNKHYPVGDHLGKLKALKEKIIEYKYNSKGLIKFIRISFDKAFNGET